MAELITLGLSALMREKPRDAPPSQVSAPAKQARSLDIARMGRLTSDLNGVSNVSADIDLWGDIYNTRARARKIAQNNPLAAKYIKLCQKNIVGDKGIQLQAKIPNKKGKNFNKKLNEQIERAWRNWCRKQNCTVKGNFTFTQAQRFAIHQWARDGECFVRLVTYNGNPYNFALQFLDPDQLDTNYYLYRMQNGNEIRMGVEVDPYGKPVAYHFWNRHPAESTVRPLARVRIPADEIIPLYLPERVMQSRGVSPMVPSILSMHMLGKYSEAELVAARVGAAKMGFFEATADDTQYTGERDDQERIKMNAEAGTIEQLPQGLTFKAWDPQHPTSAYPAFVKSSLRQIGAGLDVSYESLANDREGVNYSSIRAGLLDERDTWKVMQNWLISDFCEPIFAAWLEKAWLSGLVSLDGLPTDLTDEEGYFLWHPRGFPWVDPLKDMQASLLAVQNGFKTQTDIMAENGDDFEEGIDQIKYEQDYVKAAGVKLGTDVKGIADTADDDQSAQNGGNTQQKNAAQEKEES